MGNSRGYSNYRGRGSLGKVVLVIVLVLIILGATTFLLMQKYLVYNDDGTMRLELPWQSEEHVVAPPSVGGDEVDLVIQEQEKPKVEALYALMLSQDSSTWQQALAGLSAGGQNAVVVPMKVTGGAVLSSATADALTPLLEGEAIAQISTLRDSRYAQANIDAAGLENTGGYIFYDGNNEQWLDPNKEATVEYLTGLAETYAKWGFDEILLSDLSYPTQGKMNKIDYGGADRVEAINALLAKFREVLAGYEIRLTLELAKSVLESGGDDLAGLDVTGIYPLVDAIYVAASEAELPALQAKLPEGLVLRLVTDTVPGEGVSYLLEKAG